MTLPGKFVDKISDGVFTINGMTLSVLEESFKNR